MNYVNSVRMMFAAAVMVSCGSEVRQEGKDAQMPMAFDGGKKTDSGARDAGSMDSAEERSAMLSVLLPLSGQVRFYVEGDLNHLFPSELTATSTSGIWTYSKEAEWGRTYCANVDVGGGFLLTGANDCKIADTQAVSWDLSVPGHVAPITFRRTCADTENGMVLSVSVGQVDLDGDRLMEAVLNGLPNGRPPISGYRFREDLRPEGPLVTGEISASLDGLMLQEAFAGQNAVVRTFACSR